jgi:AraC-like DNA-binding protein
MAIGRNIMLSLCGPTWKPMEVHFRHAPPDNVSPYRHFFQAPVVFNADRTALVFRADWLSAAVPGADSQLRRHFQDYVEAMSTRLERGFQDKVYASIQRLVVENRCSLEELAGKLALHPRTLNRRLQEAGTSFRALHNQARHDLAREMLRDTTSDVTTIASLLGYTSASAFVRAFAAPRGPAASRMAQDRRGPVSRSRGRRIGREPLSVEALRFSQAVSARPVELSAPQGARDLASLQTIAQSEPALAQQPQLLLLEFLRQRHQHAGGPCEAQQPGTGRHDLEQPPLLRQVERAAHRGVLQTGKVNCGAVGLEAVFPVEEPGPHHDFRNVDQHDQPTAQNDAGHAHT